MSTAAVMYTINPCKKAIRLSNLFDKQRNTKEALDDAGGRAPKYPVIVVRLLFNITAEIESGNTEYHCLKFQRLLIAAGLATQLP